MPQRGYVQKARGHHLRFADGAEMIVAERPYGTFTRQVSSARPLTPTRSPPATRQAR